MGGRGGVSMINCSREREICNRRTQRWVQQCTICLGFSRLQPSEKKQFSFFFFLNFISSPCARLDVVRSSLRSSTRTKKTKLKLGKNFFLRNPKKKKNKKKTHRRENRIIKTKWKNILKALNKLARHFYRNKVKKKRQKRGGGGGLRSPLALSKKIFYT